MLVRQYLHDREESWRRLQALLARAEKNGVRSLSDEELREFSSLYRRATVHLAQLRTRTRERRLIEHLNDLVARGHALIYVSRPKTSLRSIALLFLRDFPGVFAETFRFQSLAVILLFGSLLVSFAATTVNPENGYAFLSAYDVRGPASDPETLQELLLHGRDSGMGSRSFFSSFLFAHNTRVGVLAFASGIFFCVPTLLLITYNGLIIGAMSAVYHRANLAQEWWAWILPHGITEFLAICIVSAAGLLLGYSLIDPGGRPRLQALMVRGRQAAVLVIGVVPMFFFAALIEGFLRQSQLPTSARFVFALLSALFWAAFFFIGSRAWAKADSGPGSPGT